MNDVADHLQAQHGLDIVAEWHHAPDQYRATMMTPSALSQRHEDLHDDDQWNEASERHSH